MVYATCSNMVIPRQVLSFVKSEMKKFLHSFSQYINAINFCVGTFYPVILLNSILGFSTGQSFLRYIFTSFTNNEHLCPFLPEEQFYFLFLYNFRFFDVSSYLTNFCKYSINKYSTGNSILCRIMLVIIPIIGMIPHQTLHRIFNLLISHNLWKAGITIPILQRRFRDTQ